MIAFIQGEIVLKTPTHVIIDTGGIGYQINISLNTYSKIQSLNNVKLYTYFHVKEDGQLLFGFADETEKNVFIHLISISGVGPNTARMILSSMNPDEVQQAIVTENEVALQNIKGIGQKTAKRIILELKDKLSKSIGTPNIASFSHNTLREEALSALVMLGFVKSAAEKAIDRVLKNQSGEINVEELIKQALKNL